MNSKPKLGQNDFSRTGIQTLRIRFCVAHALTLSPSLIMKRALISEIVRDVRLANRGWQSLQIRGRHFGPNPFSPWIALRALQLAEISLGCGNHSFKSAVTLSHRDVHAPFRTSTSQAFSILVNSH